MSKAISRFLRDERGATAIEYGIIAGLMAVLLAAIFAKDGVLSTALTNTFTFIAGQLPSA